jgi:hypothetical protein
MVLLTAGCGFRPNAGVAQTGGGDDDANPGPMADSAPVTKVWQDAAEPMDAPCADDDHDGVCNAVDTWPCGAMPTTVPGTTFELKSNDGGMDFNLGTTATKIQINGGTTLVVMTKQQAVHFVFSWTGDDGRCGGNCIDQLEVGFHPQGSQAAAHRAGCLIDQPITKNGGSAGTVDNTTEVTTPNATGVFELRAGIAQNYGCTYNGATDYYSGEPSSVMALFCIH